MFRISVSHDVSKTTFSELLSAFSVPFAASPVGSQNCVSVELAHELVYVIDRSKPTKRQLCSAVITDNAQLFAGKLVFLGLGGPATKSAVLF